MSRNAILVLTLASAVLAAPAARSGESETDFRVCDPTGLQRLPTIVSSDAAGAILTWVNFTQADGIDVGAQKLARSGASEWSSAGSRTGAAFILLDGANLVADDDGGAFVTWNSGPGNPNNLFDVEVYAQHFDRAGAALWDAGGVPVCVQPQIQYATVIVRDGSGGAILVWSDQRGTYPKNYTQRLDAAGHPAWTLNGNLICAADLGESPPSAIPDGAGGVIVAWNGVPATSAPSDIFAQRIGADGGPRWSPGGVPICTEPTSIGNPLLVSDGAGGAIIAWRDSRGAPAQIYAQRIHGDGSAVWAENGVLIDSGPSTGLSMIDDGAGGAILSWDDGHDVFAQRVSADGSVLWPKRALSSSPDDENNSKLTTDGRSGAIVVWLDQVDQSIHGQHVTENGGRAWTEGGLRISDVGAIAEAPSIASDSRDGAFVCWSDHRTDKSGDIYAHHVAGNGMMADAHRLPVGPTGPVDGAAQTPEVMRFTLPAATRVALRVYDASGRRVRDDPPTMMAAGEHVVPWPRPDGLQPGVYFYELQGAPRSARGRFVVLH